MRSVFRIDLRRWRLPCLLTTTITLALGAALAPQVAGADPVAQITEFSTGLNPGGFPDGIAPGPDGNLWFTDLGSTAAIGRITPQGHITEFSSGLNSGAHPYRIALGPDGNLWFTDNGTTKAIGRITPQGQITEFSSGLPGGSSPQGIALGPDGNLWFTDEGTTKAIGRVTPQGQITEFSGGLNSGGDPYRIAAGPDGNLWFTDQGTTAAIGRITPQGLITEFSSGLNSGANPSGIAPGPDGNLWFTDNGSTTAIGKITTGAQITEYSSGLNAGATLSSGIATGADGNVWFTDFSSTHPAIGRITPQGQIVEFSTGLGAGSQPGRIVPGSDGNLWFSDFGTTPAIGKIGTAVAAASTGAPAITGTGRAGSPATCVAPWSIWDGVTPSPSLYSFDGYQWSRDGVVIPGVTGASYTPGLGDAGHQLTCSETATYPLPLFVTASTATSPVLIVQPAIPGLTSLSVSQMRHHHHTGGVRVAYGLTAPGDVTFTVERAGSGRLVHGRCVQSTRANKRRHRCSPIVLGSFQLLGNVGSNQFMLPHRVGGHALTSGTYWLIVTPSVSGATGSSQTAKFRIR